MGPELPGGDAERRGRGRPAGSGGAGAARIAALGKGELSFGRGEAGANVSGGQGTVPAARYQPAPKNRIKTAARFKHAF